MFSTHNLSLFHQYTNSYHFSFLLVHQLNLYVSYNFYIYIFGKKSAILEAYEVLTKKTGAGNDFLGWVNWSKEYDKEEYSRIKKAAEKIRKDSEVLVVIGIGGSYLGAKAVIEAMKPYFKTEKEVEIIFAGHTLSSTYASQLLKYLENKEFSINVISKSGTTTEPAVAFRLFKELLINKYGEKEAAKRIYATTDKAKGALRVLATKEGYETFITGEAVGTTASWTPTPWSRCGKNWCG